MPWLTQPTPTSKVPYRVMPCQLSGPESVSAFAAARDDEDVPELVCCAKAGAPAAANTSASSGNAHVRTCVCMVSHLPQYDHRTVLIALYTTVYSGGAAARQACESRVDARNFYPMRRVYTAG